jgi:hypothetical protein
MRVVKSGTNPAVYAAGAAGGAGHSQWGGQVRLRQEPRQAASALGDARDTRYSLYLLYKYKSANTDTPEELRSGGAAAGCARWGA